jgi:hypothetical protein
MKPQIGDERFLVEMIDHEAVKKLASEQGWTGGDEGLREFCEPEEAAVHKVCGTLDEATKAALAWLATGRDFYGCSIIDRQVFEKPKGCPASWERQESWEVAMDGDRIVIDRTQ